MLDKLERTDLKSKTAGAPKPRLGRIEVVRRSGESLHRVPHTEDHTWAVSYADFLMVLLSFFIIFFSQGEGTDNVIFKITQELGKNSGQQGSTNQSSTAPTTPGNFSGQHPGGGPMDRAALSKDLKKEFSNFTFMDNEKEKALSILLPENIYSSGAYQLQAEAKAQFADLVKRLLPFKNAITITITGHTDISLVTQSKLKKFGDNTELSSLRAYYATKELIEQGFSEDQVRIKTLLKEQRNSRTLSLQISGASVQ